MLKPNLEDLFQMRQITFGWIGISGVLEGEAEFGATAGGGALISKPQKALH